ncbi:kinase-like domain-containing protein [Glomus cerebriforme]|uniref:non-specific serine/threonine protein kinase n=1 Tax=Glomus cerebriforme TaxID=658196 RepID=A0A397SDF8_9GLOM|nr:kinase-like domain-containing protein [Glomus cerebriforme]
MEFVPYDEFKNVEFIAEGGFSKIYKATWINGPISGWSFKNKNYYRQSNYTVVLKSLNNSKNITLELNELKIFYEFSSKWKENDFSINACVSKYFGIAQDPSENIMIIMPYYDLGDLIHYVSKRFYNLSWYDKLKDLRFIIIGLIDLHSVNIIHKDFHSGNIFYSNRFGVLIGDLGISKSTTISTEDNEIYGIIRSLYDS